MAAEAPDASSLAECLLKWVNSFSEELATPCPSLASLTDGVLLFELLSILAPAQFDTEDITKDVANNPVLATNNVNKLLRCMEMFFEDETERKIDLSYVDAAKIGRDKDEAELVKLTELVLVCAVHSARRDDAVANIMTMTEGEQHQLMFVIHDFMERFKEDAGDAGRLTEELLKPSEVSTAAAATGVAVGGAWATTSSMDGLAQSIKELQAERSDLQEQLDHRNKELREARRREEILRAQLEQAASEREQYAREAAAEALARAHKESEEKRKSELLRVQRVADEAELRAQELKAQLVRLTDQADSERRKAKEELAELKDENRKLTDELNMAKEQSKKVAQLEATLERYKQKLSSVGDVASQLKFQEDQYNAALEQTMVLEQENKQIPILKSQVSSLKTQIVALEDAVTEAKVLEQRNKHEIDQLQQEVDKLRAERNSLSQEVEQARVDLNNLRRNAGPGGALAGTGALFDAVPADVREKLIRLEVENKQLREGAMGDSRLAALNDELDLAKARAKNFEDKLLKAQLQLVQTEDALKKKTSELNEQASSVGKSSHMVDLLKEENHRLQQALAAASSGKPAPVAPAAAAAAASASSSATAEADVVILQESLAASAQKVEALQTRNKKLENYARRAQKELKSKNQLLAQQGERINILTKTVHQQELDMKQLEMNRSEMKQMTTREQRLVASAFYELGMEYHSALMAGRAVPPKERGTAGSTSWLSKQRARAS